MVDTLSILNRVPVTDLRRSELSKFEHIDYNGFHLYATDKYYRNFSNCSVDVAKDLRNKYYRYVTFRISVPKLLKLDLYSNFRIEDKQKYIYDALDHYMSVILKNHIHPSTLPLSRIDASINIKQDNINQTIQKIASLDRLSRKMVSKNSITFINTQRQVILYNKGEEQDDENVTDCLRVETRLYKKRNIAKHFETLQDIFDTNKLKSYFHEQYSKITPLQVKINHSDLKSVTDNLLNAKIKEEYGNVDNFLATLPDLNKSQKSRFKQKMKHASIDEEIVDLDKKIISTLDSI